MDNLDYQNELLHEFIINEFQFVMHLYQIELIDYNTRHQSLYIGEVTHE